jgi:hypothetical protein
MEYKIEITSELLTNKSYWGKNELGIKVDALNTFINSSPIFKGLEINESERLRHQRYIMISYFKILKEN